MVVSAALGIVIATSSCLSFTRSEEAFEILRPEYIHGTGMKVNPKCPADDVSKRSQSPAPWQLIKPFFSGIRRIHIPVLDHQKAEPPRSVSLAVRASWDAVNRYPVRTKRDL